MVTTIAATKTTAATVETASTAVETATATAVAAAAAMALGLGNIGGQTRRSDRNRGDRRRQRLDHDPIPIASRLGLRKPA
jgi:hypothetical protein